MSVLALAGCETPVEGYGAVGNSLRTVDFDPPPGDATATGRPTPTTGGTVTGEHGVGMGKMKYMTREHGDAWSVMSDIKRSFDPQNILNPGKMVQIN